LKALVDHHTLRATITGSSALQIERGRDSLAGRILTLDIGPLRLTEIAAIRGWDKLPPFQPDNGVDAWLSIEFWRDLVRHASDRSALLDRVFKAFADRGAYPMPHANPDAPWQEVAAFLNETIVDRVVQHDLQTSPAVQGIDSVLMREVLRLACRYAGHSPRPATLSKEASLVLSSISSQISAQAISNCLAALDQSLLMRTIDPLEYRRKPVKGYKKIALCDHTLRAAILHDIVPLDAPSLWNGPANVQTDAGFLAESTVGYYFALLVNKSIGHVPGGKGTLEIDYVVIIGDKRIPVEVKYQSRVDPADGRALTAFLDNKLNNAPLGLLLTRDFEMGMDIRDPRIVCLPLKALLLLR
jgi:predicted AAA+ superfamily ATPase